MKVIGISILMIVLLAGVSLSIDILLGFDVNTSVKNALNPFLVMKKAEVSIFLLFLLFLVVGSIRSFFRKRKEEAAKDKKQQQP
ncbi:hypothetical protein [Domibacillus tundrae]|uniref:hypothetical protein n=1 Tax=Domibacillus tundrae TaxID=1587527 RepID=UPI0033928BB3